MSENENSVELLEEGPCKKRFKSEIPASKVDQEIRSSYQQLRNTIQLPGFRKGHVPRQVLERKYGPQIENDVREEMMQTTFEEALKSHEFKLVGAPEFDNVEFKVGEPFTFEAVFEVAPTFEVEAYKGLEIQAEPTDVSDDDVDSEIDALRTQYSRLEDLEGRAPTGEDYVVGNIEVSVEGKDPYTREDAVARVDSGEIDSITLPDFAARAIEAKAGDTLEFDVEIGEHFRREDLQGEAAKVTFAVTHLREVVKPELDAEFTKRFGIDSADELLAEVRKSLEARRVRDEERRQENVLMTRLIDSTEMELPESVLERRKQDLKQQLEWRLRSSGVGEEEVATTLAKDQDSDKDARRDLKEVFILDWIADKETIFVTEDEVGRRLVEYAQHSGRDLQEVAEEYRSRGMLAELRTSMVREKVRSLIRRKAKVQPVDGDEPAGAAVADAGETEGAATDND